MFSDSPNARSKSITAADLDTHGILNRHSTNHPTFRVGVSEDKGTRRTMEDSHSFVVDFDAIRGQGFFAVFDGHAGKHAAEWCGSHFHEHFLDAIHASPALRIPEILNESFHTVDEHLSRMCEASDGKIHSGCTAVTAFLRLEDSSGQQSFLSLPSSPTDSPLSGTNLDSNLEAQGASSSLPPSPRLGPKSDLEIKTSKRVQNKLSSSSRRIRKALRSLGSGSNKLASSSISGSSSPATSQISGEEVPVIIPPSDTRRVLYSANAGDARGVLCRAGKAVRLTYDHKGSDKQEAKRITDAGGFVMSGRVNGVLAVTRSLGDSSMKEFVVGEPYTTETELCEEDEFLILACDGLWDVITDQGAVELVRDIEDAQEASQALLRHALENHTTDNVTAIVVRFKHHTPQAG
ncbi:protein phosphatase 2C [Phlegmacium glaucopus]|nr:protein phosphatase 2C [Phlegmacium glaucopus]